MLVLLALLTAAARAQELSCAEMEAMCQATPEVPVGGDCMAAGMAMNAACKKAGGEAKMCDFGAFKFGSGCGYVTSKRIEDAAPFTKALCMKYALPVKCGGEGGILKTIADAPNSQKCKALRGFCNAGGPGAVAKSYKDCADAAGSEKAADACSKGGVAPKVCGVMLVEAMNRCALEIYQGKDVTAEACLAKVNKLDMCTASRVVAAKSLVSTQTVLPVAGVFAGVALVAGLVARGRKDYKPLVEPLAV